MRSSRALVALSSAALLVTTATSCSLIGGDSDDDGPASDRVVLVTHESFVLPDKLKTKFETESGYKLVLRASGDAGILTNKLVLTQSDPTGDVAFGVDNTFASRAIEADVFAPYSFTLPAGAADYELPGDTNDLLTPVDNGNVCVNVDDTWFADHDVEPPTTLDDLIDPVYKDLFVLPGATTSSTGLAFLLATIAAYGDNWPDYWTDLMANGAKLTAGWSDAYEVDFTQGGGTGDRPIVLSYDSSPAFTVANGKSTTSALLDTCFEQIEYAGLLQGAANPAGGKALIEFLLSPEVQAALPENMYVFPVASDTELPAEWAKFAQQPTDPFTVDPAEIAANRDEWLSEWSDVTTR